MKNKKAGVILWILIILALAIGIGIYFLFFSGSDGGSSLLSGGSSIPQPPALPAG